MSITEAIEINSLSQGRCAPESNGSMAAPLGQKVNYVPWKVLTRPGIPILLPRPQNISMGLQAVSTQFPGSSPSAPFWLSGEHPIPFTGWVIAQSVSSGSNFHEDCLCPVAGAVPGTYLAGRLGVKRQWRQETRSFP